MNLEGEQEQERHHETEETHGFGQGETQNGVGEELLLERGVPGVADDEGTEYRSDTSTGTSDSDCGSAGTNELGGGVNVSGDWGGLETADGWQDGGFLVLRHQRRLRHALTLADDAAQGPQVLF